ncbi:MAG: DUF3795 domain-containing protein [Deltaproteobacteria bacterium]|nr:DUF3795 domain-containing protein [Deltaproteobacteria bacterium]
MTETDKKKTAAISADLIAPCGMNCRLCWGYIREKNACPGCLRIDSQENEKSKYRTTCKIKHCEQIIKGKLKYCPENCHRFPCSRLRQLDKRYRTRYTMSMIENLKMINEAGIRRFMRNESVKWICPECGEIICVHKPICLSCGYKWHQEKMVQQGAGGHR